jgi:hypothetical protein
MREKKEGKHRKNDHSSSEWRATAVRAGSQANQAQERRMNGWMLGNAVK